MIYVFGDYEFDTTLYELRHAGTPCHVEPRVFDLLAYLIQHRERVVSRQELEAHLRPGQLTGDSLLNNGIMAARRAVGNDGQRQAVIRTVRQRGYRFVAPVCVAETAIILGKDVNEISDPVSLACRDSYPRETADRRVSCCTTRLKR
jgi:DNA-binding winged helix-turn-helix (wHTH) protein